MLYRIKQPNVRKLALVKNPASGHRWHLLKSAPEDDAELEAFVDSLSPEEAAELLEACAGQPSTEERLAAAEARLAKAEATVGARHALGLVAKGSPEQQLVAVARSLEREEVRERHERIRAGSRNQPPGNPPWLYNR
jgi:hypothetical protein